MGHDAAGCERPRTLRDHDAARLALLQDCAGIAGLLALAALLSLTGCSDDMKLGARDGELAGSSRLDFGQVAVGGTSSRAIPLSNGGSAPLRILAIEAVPELPVAFRLPAVPMDAISPGAPLGLEVVFAPGEAQKLSGSIILRTDSQRSPEITLVLTGEGVHAAVNCTRTIDFGKVALNTQEVRSISCVNVGSVPAALQVAGASGLDAGLFEVGENLEEPIVTLEPGAGVGVDVRFRASRLGKASAEAIFEVEGAKDPTLAVELLAEGYASTLVAAPGCLHFGAVSPGTTAVRELLVVNGGNAPVTFEPTRLTDTTGVFEIVSTEVDGVEAPLELLAPNSVATMEVSFTPKAIESYAADILLHNDDPINPRIEICLEGFGGGADLLVQPQGIEFGRVAVGMTVKASFFAYNVGTPDGGALVIQGVTVDDRARFAVAQPVVTELMPNDAPAVIEVTFKPQVEGSFYGAVTIRSNDGDQPVMTLPVHGEAVALSPCRWQAQPSTLVFGGVSTGATATLATRIQNVGSDECIFTQVELEPGSPAFSLPGGAIAVASVMPGEALTVPVSFRTQTRGRFEGAIRFDVSDPDAPVGRIPLRADGYDGCLVANPPAIEFGVQRLSCPAATHSVWLENHCAGVAQVRSAALGTGTFTPGEISVTGPAAPYNLGVGQRLELQVRYDPVDDGDDAAPYVVSTSSQSFSIPIHGAGSRDDHRTDRYVQQGKNDVDVLLVLDNSGSMTDKQNNLMVNTARFMQYALDQGVDFHIGITTTGIQPYAGGFVICPGGVDGGEAGRLFPANGIRPRWITPSTPDAARTFADNVQVGICHWDEQGLEAAMLALSSPLVDSAQAPKSPIPNDGNLGFYRPDAKLSVIIVSDEEDHSPKSVAAYTAFFRGLKGPGNADRVKVHSVVGQG
ncbi:MAG TPA: choice-of-anchor D domain-containing protein, partial [Vulgatibacter sp.]|nr:choice-of-anchor D domain-containing protein [Vulgatibacter sp.]